MSLPSQSETVKRFLAFNGDTYYPEGGWEDYRGSSDTLEAAIELASSHGQWMQVVDLEAGEIVREGWRDYDWSARAPMGQTPMTPWKVEDPRESR